MLVTHSSSNDGAALTRLVGTNPEMTTSTAEAIHARTDFFIYDWLDCRKSLLHLTCTKCTTYCEFVVNRKGRPEGRPNP